MSWSLHGSWAASNEASGTTLTVTTDADIPAGALIVATIAYDNSGAGAPTTTVAIGGGDGIVTNTTSGIVYTGTTAGSTVITHYFQGVTVAAIPSGATITWTLSVAVVAKAAIVAAFTNSSGDAIYLQAADTASTTSAGSNAVTYTPDPAAVPVGSLAVSLVGAESNWSSLTPPTGWSAVYRESGTGGLTSVCAAVAYAETSSGSGPGTVTWAQSLTSANTNQVLLTAYLYAASDWGSPGLPGRILGGASGQFWPRGVV